MGSADDAIVPGRLDDHLATWMDQFRVPAVLISSGFLILWRNQAAADLLNGNDPGGQVGEPLVWADKRRSGQLRAMAEAMADEPQLWIYDPPERPRLLVRIEQVAGYGGGRAFGLLFYGGVEPLAPLWADLGRVFGLTPTEAVIVRGLVSGSGAEQLALDNGIALETVRTHIRRAYHKLGVNCREQLYAAVSPLCIL